MAKLDRTHQTLYKHLTHIVPFPAWAEELYASQWPLVGSSVPRSKVDLLKGAFQPLFDMGKDLKDTIKPYASWWYVKRDALQPLYGLGNLLKGAFYLIAIIPLFLFNLFRYAANVKSFDEWVGLAFIFNGIRAVSWFIDGLLSIVRGVTQIITTPLTWFIKMPMRGIITAFTDPKDLLIENKPSIQALVTEAKKEDGNAEGDFKRYKACKPFLDEIHRKYQKGINGGWASGFTSERETILYESDYDYNLPNRTDFPLDFCLVNQSLYFALFQAEKTSITPENNQQESDSLIMKKQ